MEHYKLDPTKRRSEIEPIIEKSYNHLKKQIGSRIFSILDIYGDPDNKYFIAKQIHENIFNEKCYGVDLKRELSLGHFHLMNSLITNEYSTILKLENKIDSLERDLKFYKKMYEINNNITV